MDLQIKKRVIKGLGVNVYSQVVTTIVQLVGVPVLLYAWGAELYGEWLILFAIPAYLSMSDLGFSQSAANDMTAKVAHGNKDGALVVFQSLFVLILVTATVGLAIVSGVLFFAPATEWTSFTAMSTTKARWVLWFLAAEIFVRLPDGINHAGYRACGDYAFHFGLHATSRLAQFAGAWLVALGGGGPVGAALTFFIIRGVATVLFGCILVHRHTWLKFGFFQASTLQLRNLFKPALANIAVPLAQALNIQGMILVVGAFLGPLAVVIFSTLRTLSRLALQLGYVISNATEPELAAAYGVENMALTQTLFVHSLRTSFWLALPFAAVLGIFGNTIITIWTHGVVEMNSVLFTWLLISAVFGGLWYGALNVLKAANRHLRAASFFVLSSVVTVAAASVLLSSTGYLANAGLVLLLMDVTMIVYTIPAACRHIAMQPAECFKQAVDPRPLVKLALARIRIR